MLNLCGIGSSVLEVISYQRGSSVELIVYARTNLILVQLLSSWILSVVRTHHLVHNRVALICNICVIFVLLALIIVDLVALYDPAAPEMLLFGVTQTVLWTCMCANLWTSVHVAFVISRISRDCRFQPKPMKIILVFLISSLFHAGAIIFACVGMIVTGRLYYISLNVASVVLPVSANVLVGHLGIYATPEGIAMRRDTTTLRTTTDGAEPGDIHEMIQFATSSGNNLSTCAFPS
ncbi:hypothetical protein C8Q78DRAFT_1042686 [Trametes maxima]|nr:hypothetical protein C8Q78DRAFT_1042686 [Trametes maxima]